jgi:hypothetical protein
MLKTLIRRYTDYIAIIGFTLVLLLFTETGHMQWIANYSVVFLMGAYFLGKIVSRWQRKPEADSVNN